ncbi:MAG: divalent-cation tolerance protein CutA [Gemmatimonadetes bacterium]|nr:divalent-cation tolerance protein CutA [Gemmatimonadota bacterium]
MVVLTTLGNAEDAHAFVRALVDRRLVACGTIVPGARSIYRWKGKIADEHEAVVLLKTQRDRWPDLVDAVRTLHPYKVPELLALPVSEGLPAYLDWVTSETISKE